MMNDQRLRWTLDNIYTIARREANREDTRGRWGHVLRLCEAAGCHGRGVLRDNGGDVTGSAEPAGDAAAAAGAETTAALTNKD